MSRKNNRQFLSILALVLASVIWGGSFVVTKDTLDYIGPLWQLAFRLSIASAPALLLAILFHNRWNHQLILKSFLLGCAFFAALCFQNVGMQYVTASKSGFLTTTYVAFIPLIEIVVLRRKIDKRHILASVICMTGAALLSLQESLLPKTGDLLILACGLMYAVHILYADHCKNQDVLMLHIGQVISATIFSLFFAILFEKFPAEINTHCFLGLCYCGLLEVFLCFFLQIVGQKNVNASLSSILLSMESVYSAFFAVLFLGDSLTLSSFIGSALIFISAIVSGA